MSMSHHHHRQYQHPYQQPLMMTGGGWSFGNGVNIETIYTKIFVGGLAWETQKDTMSKYFEQFGEIVEAVVITDKATGRSKGYGFVTFKEPDAALRACHNPSPVIDGRRANCNLACMGAVSNKNHYHHHHHAGNRFRGGLVASPPPPPVGLVTPTPAPFPASPSSSSSTPVYFHQPSSAHQLTFPPSPYSSTTATAAASYGYSTGFSHDSMYPNTSYYGMYGGGQPQYYYPTAAAASGGGYSQAAATYYPYYYSPYTTQIQHHPHHHHPTAATHHQMQQLYHGGATHYSAGLDFQLHYSAGLDFTPQQQLPLSHHHSAGILSLPDNPAFATGIKTVTGLNGTGSRSTTGGQSLQATSDQNSSTSS